MYQPGRTYVYVYVYVHVMLKKQCPDNIFVRSPSHNLGYLALSSPGSPYQEPADHQAPIRSCSAKAFMPAGRPDEQKRNEYIIMHM